MRLGLDQGLGGSGGVLGIGPSVRVGELVGLREIGAVREDVTGGRRVVFERGGVTYAWWVVSEDELREAVRRAGPGARAALGHRGADGMGYVMQRVYSTLELERDLGDLPGEWTFVRDL